MAVWLSMSLSQGTPNETARTNTVTATVTVHYSGGSYNGNSPSGTVTINGQSSSFTCNFNYAGIGQGAVTTGTGSVVAATRTVTVSYGSSSTKTVSASASFSSGTASGTVSTSGSINLIPIGASSGGGTGGDSGDDDDDNTEEWDPDNPGSGGDYGDDYDPSLRLPGNCTVVGQAMLQSAQDNITYYPKPSYYIINHENASYEQIVIIKFITPEFNGISRSLDIDFYDTTSANSRFSTTLCCAICASDENNGMYFDAQSVVNDPTQIASVLLLDEEYLSFNAGFSINTDQLESNKEYYLMLWQPTDHVSKMYIEIGPARYHGINVNYDDSGGDDSGGDDIVTSSKRVVFYIDNGTEYTEYECYIDNGTSWDLAGIIPTSESEYHKNEGTLFTNADETAVSVDCGFYPDLVVLHSSETYEGYHCSCAASFDVHNGAVNTAVWSNQKDEWIDMYIHREDQGFSVYACGPDKNAIALTFKYVAIKYR